jgi:exosortase K
MMVRQRLSLWRTRIKKRFRRLSPHPRPFSQREKGEIPLNFDPRPFCRSEKGEIPKQHQAEVPKELYAQFAVVVLCGVALKYFYSTASVNELRWILAPTTFAVEFISRERFEFESYAGYINGNHTFVIAASCAGVNFLLTAFLMLSLGELWRNRRQNVRWSFFPLAALVSYVATLIANTVRITTALELRNLRIESSWLSAGEIHRLEGIFVYFGFLLLLYVLTERMNGGTSGAVDDRSSLLRRSVFPLLIYYGTTLGIPVLNGAFRQAEFWQHSRFVLMIPLVFVVPIAVFQKVGTSLAYSK